MDPIGSLRHRVTVQNPTGSVPDGDGGYTDGWGDADPHQLDVSITPASARDLERTTAATSLATATHIVRGRWHPQITTASRLLFKGRTFAVIFVGNPEERDREIVLIVGEVLSPPSPATASSAAAPAWVAQQPVWNTD